MSLFRILGILALGTLPTGCMSLVGLFGEGMWNQPYCGVVGDVVLMRRYGGGAHVLIADVPFSAVMDTALLPMTIPAYFISPPRPIDWTTREEALREHKSSASQETGMPDPADPATSADGLRG